MNIGLINNSPAEVAEHVTKRQSEHFSRMTVVCSRLYKKLCNNLTILDGTPI